MSYLTNFEALAAKEKEIFERERAVSAREKRYAEREKDFSPHIRLAMVATAQCLGFILLFLLGFGPISFGQQNESIARGLDFIKLISYYYLGLSALIFIIPGAAAIWQKELKHGHVDSILIACVVLDMFLLLFLVHQQGGLCRSMFLPVFFLIPTAYLVVERREKKYRPRRLLVLLAVVACICRTYHVAVALMPPAGGAKPVEDTVHLLWWSKSVTDFSALAHSSYDKAVFAASLISAFVPILQLVAVMLRDRFRGEEDEGVLLPLDVG